MDPVLGAFRLKPDGGIVVEVHQGDGTVLLAPLVVRDGAVAVDVDAAEPA